MVVSSIDIMQGKVVQLRQGQDKMLERDDPLALAALFDKYGEIAVIDLDAAMGKGENGDLIKDIVKCAECRVGGGIRTIERARELIDYGARKVIIGSQAFENNQINHAFLQALVSQIGRQRVIIAVDALHGEIVTRGWKHQTNIPLFQAVTQLEPYTSEFLFTCVEREGTLKGTDMAIVKELRQTTNNQITVAGGVATLAEVKELAALGVDVQLGMAIYTGKIKLTEAFIESLNWQKMELLPTITQDETGQVLMLAYSNKESLQKAFDTEKMTYFSRSRNTLWTKGETSGHGQHLIRMRADCDRDTLLATVRQTGVACHVGSYSCFGDKRFSLQELYSRLEERIRSHDPKFYTATLTGGLVKEKILEEAQEIIKAESKAEVIWEVADMLYFLSVLLVNKDVTVDEVLAELARRRG